jgi:hypothetical protein
MDIINLIARDREAGAIWKLWAEKNAREYSLRLAINNNASEESIQKLKDIIEDLSDQITEKLQDYEDADSLQQQLNELERMLR